jgi:hypothetical protein
MNICLRLSVLVHEHVYIYLSPTRVVYYARKSGSAHEGLQEDFPHAGGGVIATRSNNYKGAVALSET